MISFILVSAVTVGFVHSAMGNVTLTGHPVTGLTRAVTGSLLAVGPKGSAIYVARGKGLRYRLTGPYQGRCESGDLHDLRGHAVPLPALAAIPRAASREGLGSAAGVVVRGDERVEYSGLFPFGLVLPDRLRIHWEGRFSNDDFVVRIAEPDADEPVWSRTVPGIAREAVCDVRLEPGKRYVVSVTARNEGAAAGDAESAVEVCDAATAATVAAAGGTGEARAELLLACGLDAEAADEYERVGTEAAKRRVVELRGPGRVRK